MGAGADRFVFTRGRDEIDDMTTADQLVIDLNSCIDTRAEFISAARAVDDGDLLIGFGDGTTLRLDDTTRAELRSFDLDFV